MSATDKTTGPGRQCASCGARLPAESASELCAKCLLEAGFRTEPSAAEPGAAPPPTRAAKGLPQPGEDFGHYHLIRRLGQGGMGVVYEAEDTESGRRLALKVLSQALDSPEARKRFLREGQLAASINHPNSVYVFGTEEIAGTPVIAMELVPGGTLQDRVAASGPLPVTEAVDCVVQLIAGLEAAQQAGITHRDIKPSNCFVDSGGTVKIGDFGLSISTGVRTEPDQTAAGTVFGTPSFSSPEQLRGDELTLRSDIYAVGVTLYYLLTARKPFDAPNVIQLLATVLERRAESPAKWRPEVPSGLGRVVLRCLEKDPRERYSSYASLREALLPFAAAPATPATLGLRFLAGGIDLSLLVPVLSTFGAAVHGWGGTALFYAVMLLYFGGLEGLWGASLGKAILRLRVIRPGASRLDIGRAFLRAALFLGGSLFATDLFSIFVLGIKENASEAVPTATAQGISAILIFFVLLALLFITARRRNGFAGVHDRLSGTRVVSRAAFLARPKLSPQPESLGNLESAPRLGPYYLLRELGQSNGARMLLAYDTRLLRKVWVREPAPGAAPVPAELRNLARPTRLRWLNGRRSATEAWDAYQALDGQPLLDVIAQKQSWASVRFWLLDLATELQAALEDGLTSPALRLDHLWLSADGRIVLLDFPAHSPSGSTPHTASSGEASRAFEPPPTPAEFLRQVALSALQGRALSLSEARRTSPDMPLPVHARIFIEGLVAGVSAGDAARLLQPLLTRKTTVTLGRRFALLGGLIWLPVLMTGTVFLMAPKQIEGLAEAIVLTWVYGVGGVILPCWLAALCFRGGPLLRGLGVAVVTRRGQSASRARVFWRNFVATLPFVVLPCIAMVRRAEVTPDWTGWALVSTPLLLALISVLLPRRTLQDRLAGTVLVPR